MNPETPFTASGAALPTAPGPIGNGPQKRRRTRLIIVSIIILLLLVGGSVVAYYLLNPAPVAEEQKTGGDPEDRLYVSPRKDVDSSTSYENVEKVAHRFGHFEITLNSVTNNYQLKDDPAPEGFTFLLVNISAKNVDSGAHLLSDADVNILVGEDTIISPLITRTVAPALIPKAVEPDGTVTGNLLYQVPKDATGLKLYYKTEIFSEKTQKLEKLEYTMSL